MINASIPKNIFILSAFTFVLSGCFDKNEAPAEQNNQLPTASFKLSRVLAVAPPIEVQTPASFKSTSTVSGKLVSRAAHGTSCDQYGIDPADPKSEYSYCKIIKEMKSLYFSPGLLELRSVLSYVDESVTFMLGEGTDYIPCLDRENTAGGSSGMGTEVNEYVAFAENTFTLNKTFADGGSYDAEATYHLSCVMEMNAGEGYRSIGIKDGVTYFLANGGTLSGLAIIDANTNIDYWFSVGNLDSTFDPATSTEIMGPTGTTGVSYLGSTGLAHVRSNAGGNSLELALTGVGMGDDCGARLLTDGNFLFYEVNRNYYGRCTATDTSAVIYDGAGGDISAEATFNPELEKLTYCFDVSSDEPVKATDESCSSRGLTSEDFNVKALTRDSIKAYNTVTLFPTEKPTGVAPFQGVPREIIFVPDESDLETYVEDNIYLPNIAKLNSRTAGFCRDEADTVAAAIDTAFELDMSTLSAETLTAINSAYAVRLYAQVDSGYKDKTTYRYWSDFTSSVVLTKNDIAVGVAVDLITNSVDGIQNITFTFEGDTFLASDKLKIQMTGTSQYQCSDGAPNLGSAATAVGMGRVRLAYYTPPLSDMGPDDGAQQ